MYEKASFVFWTTLILYIITLATVSYVGVYITYIALPFIVISGLIMKFSEPSQRSKEIMNTTKATLKTVENTTNSILNETNSFLEEINNSLEKINLLNQKIKPLKNKVHKLEIQKLDNKLHNRVNDNKDIDNEIIMLKDKIKEIET